MNALAAAVVVTGLLGTSPVPAASADSHARVACTITGTRGADVLRGTPQPDVVCGGRGDDTLVGGDGADVLLGGPGADVLRGGEGGDRLFGGRGGDDLYDSRGRIDGGSGVDYCPWDAVSTACETDVETATTLVRTNLPASVELSGVTRTLRVRIHLRDPLGVDTTAVSLSRAAPPDNTGLHLRLRLASGTPRDGLWVGALELPAHQPSGDYTFRIDTQGRFAGPSGVFVLPASITNSASDATPPLVTRTSGIAPGEQFPLSEAVALRVGVRDDLAGTRSVTVRWYNTSTRTYVETEAQRVRGTSATGVWRAALARPQRIGAGPAEFAITVVDKAGNRQQYWGPWQMAWLSAISYLMLPIPDDAGPFELVP